MWCWCAVVLSVSLTSNTASNLKDFFLNIYPKCIISSIHAIGLTNFKGMHVRAANLCAKNANHSSTRIQFALYVDNAVGSDNSLK